MSAENPASPVISVAVMAHPSRKDAAERVAERLACFDARVVFDPEPDAPPSAMRTARLAWRAHDPSATHHLVVQDDITVPDGFEEALTAAVRLQPERVFNVWNEWTNRSGAAIRLAAYSEADWAPVSDRSVVAVAVVMPTAMIADFLDYLPRHPDDRDSGALFEFLRMRGEVALTTVPCLVQHDEPMVDSLWRRNLDQGPRRAAVYPGKVSAESLTNVDVVRFGCLPYLPLETLSSAVAAPRPGIAEFELRSGVDCLRVLEETRETMSERFMDEVFSEVVELRRDLSPAHLFHAWLTAVFSGYEVFASYGRAPRVDGEVVELALRSLLVGALKRTLPVRTLDRLGDANVGWLGRGLSLGADYARKSRVRSGLVPPLAVADG
ncbi:hypothetical protein [Phytomonospora endophytica]|uniref:Uncharacterized protein n=1 Tax=Phytomonospora endophytica TaxID=714109 RepID=A0A841FNZ4_9ACTN|nr:hypothetical protein [Phytomonospora endophytica]MBB6034309.1 hypothetical protein [Phytomonospora endophytica]GIG66703.1 hypothetical protein Pen01_29980 [Phytomonospora endophytica]